MIRQLVGIFCLGGLSFLGCAANVTLTLTEASIKQLAIKTAVLVPGHLEMSVSGPGEVVGNANSTTKVTIRVPAEVLKRAVNEGEFVQKNQLLTVLSSVEMAKVQSTLILADKEWKRVQSLGKDAVSAKRYMEAEIKFREAHAIALSYGMTVVEIQHLLQMADPDNVRGEFSLYAAQEGTVSGINFVEGELISPGQLLMQIVNEETVWIDVKLPPAQAESIRVGGSGYVVLSPELRLPGIVVQIHPKLEPITRTRVLRLQLQNPNKQLHPGQFVSVQLMLKPQEKTLVLPAEAVIKTSHGSWVVFVERTTNVFEQIPVNVVQHLRDQVWVSGPIAHQRVVIHGAFFIYSELNKHQFESPS